MSKGLRWAWVPVLMIWVGACAPGQRMGMVVDPETGLQYGSVIERNIVVDPSQFRVPRIKLNIRNTSGDPAFDLHGFRARLEQAYADKGYETTRGSDFGILLDVNVMYSGQVTTSLATEFGFLGAAAGGVAGYRSSAKAGTGIGVVSGATLGAISGSYIREDTYIVVGSISLGVAPAKSRARETTIVFNASRREKKVEPKPYKPFQRRAATDLAVFAGGRNVRQAAIAEEVRQRFARILADVI